MKLAPLVTAPTAVNFRRLIERIRKQSKLSDREIGKRVRIAPATFCEIASGKIADPGYSKAIRLIAFEASLRPVGWAGESYHRPGDYVMLGGVKCIVLPVKS